MVKQVTKSDLKKINDWIWEIPKTFRSDMRVPARVYTKESMLDSILGDKSTWQLVNVATLPGIQKYALAMPDIHQGYGFPIGGVAAFDVKGGVISPGGVGYDINCLHPESEVLLDCGARIKISQIDKFYKSYGVALCNKRTREIDNAIVRLVERRLEKSFLLKIRTKFGHEIKATSDHPIYTSKGMIEAGKIKEGDEIIVHGYRGQGFEISRNAQLVSEKKVEKTLIQLGLENSGNRWGQVKKYLRERLLLNLQLSSSQISYLSKIIGFLIGDGHVGVIGREEKATVAFYGKKDDLIDIQQDLKKIGVSAKIYHRKRTHKVKTVYNKEYEFEHDEYMLKNNSLGFLVLLKILGVPLGNKTQVRFGVPSWIKKSPRLIKRNFVSGFFGAEMTTPKLASKHNFFMPTLNINKSRSISNDGREFLEEVRTVLADLGVKSSKVVHVPGLSSKKTAGYRFQIRSNDKNLWVFFSQVGYEYNREKQRIADLAAVYLGYKSKVIQKRKSVRKNVRKLFSKGIPVSELRRKYSGPYTPAQFIEHSVWSNGRKEPRVPDGFDGFEKFVRKNKFVNRFVKDSVVSVSTVSYAGYVYDLTVGHSSHNFIANGVVVSNCGMRLLATDKRFDELQDIRDDIAHAIQRSVPSGVGRGGRLSLSASEVDAYLKNGAKEMVKNGYGKREDLDHIESGGVLDDADPVDVSDHAKKRGRDQLGTLGAGNHFVDVCYINEVFDEEEASRMGIHENQVVVLIHTGSRGLGHQIATDYVQLMMKTMIKYGIEIPDRELACAPFQSEEGQRYWRAMCAGANFAWANRQMITYEVRDAWDHLIGGGNNINVVYDVAHNIAKVEKHKVDGKAKQVIVHRKGATRAFPGQPVIIPGTMATSSYVLVGQESSMDQCFGSTCHGAGRRMSRSKARRTVQPQELKKRMEEMGISVASLSVRGFIEEAPESYKDIEDIVHIVHNAGIAKKVVGMMPFVVVKC